MLGNCNLNSLSASAESNGGPETYMARESRVTVHLLPVLRVKDRMIMEHRIMESRGEPCFGASHLKGYQLKFHGPLNIPHANVLQKDRVVTARSQGVYTEIVGGQLHFFIHSDGFSVKVLPKEFTSVLARIPKSPSLTSWMRDLLGSTT